MKRYIHANADQDWVDANSNDPYVRQAVAWRTNDPEILTKLADDKEWSLREIVAWRTNDFEILTKLADDESWYVRKVASEKLKKSKSAKSNKKSKQLRNYDDDYQAAWDIICDEWYAQGDSYDIDQSTQGNQGSTDLIADDGSYFRIWEPDALEAAQQVFDEGGSVEEMAEAIKTTGSWYDPD